MLTVFLYIVLIRKSRLIIHMQIWMMRNDYQADKKEPKLRSTKSSSYLFQWKVTNLEIEPTHKFILLWVIKTSLQW